MAEEEEGLEAEIVYPITCGDSRANLIWRKFVCPGINVKCVQVRLRHCLDTDAGARLAGGRPWGPCGGLEADKGPAGGGGVTCGGWKAGVPCALEDRGAGRQDVLRAQVEAPGAPDSLLLEAQPGEGPCSCGGRHSRRMGSRLIWQLE